MPFIISDSSTIAFLRVASRVSDLETSLASARSDLTEASDEVRRVRDGENEARANLRDAEDGRREAAKELKELEAFLFDLEARHAEERRSWSAREEEMQVLVDEGKVRVRELSLGRGTAEGDKRLRNRITIIEAELGKARSRLEEAVSRNGKLRSLERELESVRVERERLADELLGERRRNLRDRAREVERVEGLLRAREER